MAKESGSSTHQLYSWPKLNLNPTHPHSVAHFEYISDPKLNAINVTHKVKIKYRQHSVFHAQWWVRRIGMEKDLNVVGQKDTLVGINGPVSLTKISNSLSVWPWASPSNPLGFWVLMCHFHIRLDATALGSRNTSIKELREGNFQKRPQRPFCDPALLSYMDFALASWVPMCP